MTSPKILGLLLLIVSSYSNPAPKKLTAENSDYRLPAGVAPTKYTIALTFPETAFTSEGTDFKGTVTIDISVTLAITEIKFHVSNDITISTLTLDTHELTATDYTFDAITEILTIPINEMTIEVGNTYPLAITYTGKISTNENKGIYKSSYTNANKETVYLLSTQLEPVYARRAFPCFDEPSLKATFDVSVTYPSTKNLGVLFNTEIKAGPTPVEGEDMNLVSFETTPKMSSYLVALVISDFTSTTAVNVVGDTTVAHTVWSRDNMATSRAYAQEVGPIILQKLNEYTLRLYGTDMTKLAQIALPELSVEAMENWGLVTYSEELLLWNTEDYPTASKRAVAQIIAHELAHQWFGNLVTCTWWSETYLNEGFATYFEHIIINEIEPTWEVEQQFVLDTLQPALAVDSISIADSQALVSEAFTPLQVHAKFGDISYKKGASILRMFAHIMGEANFKTAIQDYFTDTGILNGVTTSAKLGETLEKNLDTTASGLPNDVTVTEVMAKWLDQPGYPLLTVSLDGKTLKISQERFLQTEVDADTKWYVPITYTESTSTTKFQDTKPVDWLTPDIPEITLTLENDNDWVILNSLQTGYYRVNYDANSWTKIAAALNTDDSEGIVDLNKAQIVDDLFSLAHAGKLSYSVALGSVDFLRKETSYYAWLPAIKGFNFIIQRFGEGTQLRKSLEGQLLTLIQKLYDSVSFEDLKDDQTSTQKQVLAISWACKLGLEDCVTKSNAAFQSYYTDKIMPNKNLRSTIYCQALKNADDNTNFDYLWSQYLSVEVDIEKINILSSLGCTKDEALLKTLLEHIIQDESQLRKQDYLATLVTVYSSSEKGTQVALLFLVENAATVFKRITTSASQKDLITGIAGRITNIAQVLQLRTLIESSADISDDVKANSQAALTQAEANIKWASDHKADLEKFFIVPNGASTSQINIILLVVISALSLFGVLAL